VKGQEHPGNKPNPLPMKVREDNYRNKSEELYSAQETGAGNVDGLSQFCHDPSPQGELPVGG